MKKKVLFIYEHKYPNLWRDGLYAAINILRADFEVVTKNLAIEDFDPTGYDFVLAWGGFDSPSEKAVRDLNVKKGLCIGGIAYPPVHRYKYDVLFYETEWYVPQIEDHPNKIHAFGVNTEIYKKEKTQKIFDVLTVGAFSTWKRQHLITEKPGVKLAIGEIQKGNLTESLDIADYLIAHGCGVMDMIKPEDLAKIYNASRLVYIPAEIDGGGERSVLEARACDVPVEIENDNPKLKELLTSPIWDEKYYAKQLKKGILSVL